MLSATWFFCDIAGTFDILSDNEREEMFQKLENIRQLQGNDVLVFSFLSSVNYTTIKEVITYYVQPLLVGKNIIMGPSDGYNGTIENDDINQKLVGLSKGSKIISHIQNINNFKINDIIYADDHADEYIKLLIDSCSSCIKGKRLTIIGKKNLKLNSKTAITVLECDDRKFLLTCLDNYIKEKSSLM